MNKFHSLEKEPLGEVAIAVFKPDQLDVQEDVLVRVGQLNELER